MLFTGYQSKRPPPMNFLEYRQSYIFDSRQDNRLRVILITGLSTNWSIHRYSLGAVFDKSRRCCCKVFCFSNVRWAMKLAESSPVLRALDENSDVTVARVTAAAMQFNLPIRFSGHM